MEYLVTPPRGFCDRKMGPLFFSRASTSGTSLTTLLKTSRKNFPEKKTGIPISIPNMYSPIGNPTPPPVFPQKAEKRVPYVGNRKRNPKIMIAIG